MARVYTPGTVPELSEIILSAAADETTLGIHGGRSKQEIGAPTVDADRLDMRRFSGVVDYDPPELVLTVRAGTALSEVQSRVAEQGQMLAFDPWDHGRMMGREPGAATIGGVVAAGVAGPRRLSAGGARDHLLGFEAVNGRGEVFKAGSRVVKNVTGFDLSKLVTGSWGRIVAITQLTLKVLPRPESSETLLIRGLAPDVAVAQMGAALASPAAVAAAAHVPSWEDQPATLLRLEGIGESVTARASALRAMLGAGATLDRMDGSVADMLWGRVADADLLHRDRPLWRIVIAPSRAAAFVDALGHADWLIDWGGALVWAATDLDANVIRDAARSAGGHAMLVRAGPRLRHRVPAFHPPDPGVGRLERRLRNAFDPDGVFDTGRF